MTSNKRLGGGRFSDFLREDGVEEAVDTTARERVRSYLTAKRLHELAKKGREWLELARDEQLRSFKE